MEDPHPLGRYLGIPKAIQVSGPPGKSVTEVYYNMKDFFLSRSPLMFKTPARP